MRWARAQWRVGRTVPACAPVSAKHCCRPHDRGGGQPSTRRPNTRFSDRGGLSILSIGPKPRACCTRLRCNPSESVGARFVVSSHRRQICDRRRGPPSALGTPHNVSSPSLSPRQAGRSSHSMLRISPSASPSQLPVTAVSATSPRSTRRSRCLNPASCARACLRPTGTAVARRWRHSVSFTTGTLSVRQDTHTLSLEHPASDRPRDVATRTTSVKWRALRRGAPMFCHAARA